MQTEPHEMRLRRTSRTEALRRAATLVGDALDEAEAPLIEAAAAATPSTKPDALDEAFADLPTRDLATELSAQLRQLDAQRRRLASLLAGLGDD